MPSTTNGVFSGSLTSSTIFRSNVMPPAATRAPPESWSTTANSHPVVFPEEPSGLTACSLAIPVGTLPVPTGSGLSPVYPDSGVVRNGRQLLSLAMRSGYYHARAAPAKRPLQSRADLIICAIFACEIALAIAGYEAPPEVNRKAYESSLAAREDAFDLMAIR